MLVPGLPSSCRTLWLAPLLVIAGCGSKAQLRGSDAGGTSPCASGVICDSACTDLASDVSNCGACGRACAPSEVCAKGRCASACEVAGLSQCGSACRDLTADSMNCGACGAACATGQVCSGGKCDVTCSAGYALCQDASSSGYCAALDRDINDCGSCGVVCPSGASCVGGQCSCPAGATTCMSNGAVACVDLQYDSANCGGCGRACPDNMHCGSGECADNDNPAFREHSETITTSAYSYTIVLDGTLDGPTTRDPIGYAPPAQGFEPNTSVTMTNVGAIPVQNPWIKVAGRVDLSSQAGMVASAISPAMTDREKALSLLWQHIAYRFHGTTNDADNDSPVKLYNVYGFGYCGDDSFVLGCLVQVAGFSPPRYPYLAGHAVPEVWFDGRWNLLDGDEEGVHLLRDNYTIASNADIVRDPDLIKRSHSYGVAAISSRQQDEMAAAVFYSGAYNTMQDVWNADSSLDTMNMTLRPNESIEWRWGMAAKYHGQFPPSTLGSIVPTRIANGRWSYALDFTAPSWTYAATWVLGATADTTGLHATAQAGSIGILMQSPYPFVGGTLSFQGPVNIYLSWDDTKWVSVPVPAGASMVSLDNFFPPNGAARYAYYLKLEVQSAPLTSFTITNDIEMAPLAMPGLQLGNNVFQYSDGTAAEHSVEVTHRWQESYANRPPAGVSRAVFPADNGMAVGSQLQFKWQPPVDPDGDAIVDYEFVLSDRSDVRWPLSSNFRRQISKTPDVGQAQFTLPYAGLLNSDTTYYWKVRPRDARGAWGPWSPIFSFKTVTPHPPVNLRLLVDTSGRTATLLWDPATTGTSPVEYKVYGSNEQGFTPSDAAYDVWVGNQTPNALTSPFASNLLGTTTKTSYPVIGASLSANATNLVFYRVVAVDANGLASGPSDFIEAPHPFIFSQPATGGVVGQPYSYRTQTLASLGAPRYIMNGELYEGNFWDVEHPTFALPSSPAWLQIDAQSGVVRGTPPASGSYPVQVTAQIGALTDSQSFTIVVP